MIVKRYRLGIVVGLLIFPFANILAADTVAYDIASILAKLKENIGPITKLIFAISYLIGFVFVGSALMRLKEVGKSMSASASPDGIKGSIVKLLIGIVLIYLPSTINIGVATFWGNSKILEYTSDSSGTLGEAKEGAVALMQIIGYVSFVRGLILLNRASQSNAQPGTVGKGILHLVGGVLSINIVGTLEIVQNTFGLNIL